MPRKLFFIIIAFALILVLTGCEKPVEQTDNAVDPVFREFYELLGGQEVLGPVISVMYEENNKKLQFTAAALMIFDPQAPESARYQLAPLGHAMKVAEPPSAPTLPNEHEIYPGFLPLFRQLGGTRYTGQPLTGVKADPENQRIVQYFENVGFYQLTSDSPDEAHLLHYGVWKCAYACNFGSPKESIVIPPSVPGYDFSDAVDFLEPGLTGLPLTEIYINSDGQSEQIFENLVIRSDQFSPEGIVLLPLPKILGIQPDTLAPAGKEDGKFIAIEGNQGFNVPKHFDNYIERHKGYEFIGFPINNFREISENLSRQCFENICIEYYPNEIDSLQIRPMPLGRRYKQQFSDHSIEGNGTNSFDAVTLKVWERLPVINFTEGQEIYVIVLDNGTPLKNIDLTLDITMPDGTLQTLDFPSTSQDGQTSLEIGAIDAPNGTLIVYQVCIDHVQDGPDCITEDYLIWGNP